MKFELGTVAVGQLLVLALNPPILTVIPLFLPTQSFLASYAEEEDTERHLGALTRKRKCFFFGIRKALRKKLNFQLSKGSILFILLHVVTL